MSNKPISLLLIGAVCWGQAGLSEESIVCCPAGFTRERAVAAARSWANREKGQVKLLWLTDDPRDMLGHGGGSDISADRLEALFRLTWSRSRNLALFLQTGKGSAIDFWDGRTRTFERRLLSGENPFWISESTEILFVRYDRGAVEFWCKTPDGDDPAVGRALLGRLAELIKGVRVRVTWSDNPWFLEDPNYRFFPSLGWMGLPIRGYSQIRNFCELDADGKSLHCP